MMTNVSTTPPDLLKKESENAEYPTVLLVFKRVDLDPRAMGVTLTRLEATNLAVQLRAYLEEDGL